MTTDVIALTEGMPDPWSIMAALLAGGPEPGVRTAGQGAVLQLCDPDGAPLVSVEAPLRMGVRGEAERLLGVPLADGTGWWTEIRAATGVPGAERLARAVAGRLTDLLGGAVWPPDASGDVPEAGGLVDVSGVTAAEPPELPAVDVLTGQAAVILQDRPLIAMTSLLSEALRTSADADRGLQIVTPGHSRLSLPTRSLLTGPPLRWVVRDERCGYYDGLSGAVLGWRDGTFAPVADAHGRTLVADAFREVDRSGERQLVVAFRTCLPASEDLVLGGAVEAAWQTLTGAPPAGWGSAEPAGLPWSREEATSLARRRSPRPTWLVVVGAPDRPAVATLRVDRTPEGVAEDVTLALGYGPGERPPVEALPELADTLASRSGLRSLVCHLRPARRDLSVPPRFEAPPVPVAFALGSEGIRSVGFGHAARAPLAGSPLRVGPPGRPGLYYPLGDGSSHGDGWAALERLTRHLRGAGRVTA
ncbi:DUF6177 family protein [Streptomyces sp. URMC 126]|uniref:DUF6177 family protein n=1 Tax=Streptomyces sp. URMC 126 TaxID=3423401 RepID=UPI003F1B7898